MIDPERIVWLSWAIDAAVKVAREHATHSAEACECSICQRVRRLREQGLISEEDS